ncbi:hypothetical protein LLY42_05505 [Pseudomonas frederiksbergensis]|uniref:Uncharacterized protein n=2 Tax=Pseudomonas TaxID=286 RepID=A0ABY9EWD3_9PSED|nr:hypothetical protein [Pseudomonas cucumis]URM29074.1 hypothetical protein LLY42_05505 [Pseudomonas frederiksbergensis]WLG84828.1 hypothetical protein PSH97_27780 [Pseudomonas cucumis]WLG90384.1 hypothetical protein PSH72_28340 [Pseudomonas cucumis]
MIKRTLLMLLSGCLPWSLDAWAGQQPLAAPSNQVIVAGQTLTLENHDQQCALRKQDQSILKLDMPWPCFLSVDRKGQPRVETFNNAQIIIVEHSTPEPLPSRDCDARYQAIRQIKGQPMEVSKVAHSAGCMTGVMDQKNFVAHFSW